MNLKEIMYQYTRMRDVAHATLNPKELGMVRIHMIPPKFNFRRKPFIIILNGNWIIPINVAWAILLSTFIKELNYYHGMEISDNELKDILRRVVISTKRIYPRTSSNTLQTDLNTILSVLTDISYGKNPKIEIGQMSLREYAKYMTAPHRMDLMISSMKKDGHWNCNQKCVHCYAAGQFEAESSELNTTQWKKVIDICRQNNIPQITFTGGEPTMREDLVELLEYSKWFLTRLNTNGVKLTAKLCSALYEASLDNVQITFYSADSEQHNRLVGSKNYDLTLKGIHNALNAGLSVSINTPLCSINRDYVDTLKLLHAIGITYVTCSSLIITGNAKTTESVETQLQHDELYSILSDAVQFCKENKMEISFTSPGWLTEQELVAIGLSVPGCGACLSNMAIAPDGSVVPCQSWLEEGSSLGNILTTTWENIWNHPKSKAIRKTCELSELTCLLRKN